MRPRLSEFQYSCPLTNTSLNHCCYLGIVLLGDKLGTVGPAVTCRHRRFKDIEGCVSGWLLSFEFLDSFLTSILPLQRSLFVPGFVFMSGPIIEGFLATSCSLSAFMRI